MSKKKPLSLDEKRNRMLSFFHETKDFYQLKEVESICSKERGITLQSCKDVLQALVDDSLVDSSKIGTSVYYWSYPGKVIQMKRVKRDATKKELSTLEATEKDLTERVNEAKKAKNLDDNHADLLKTLAKLQSESAAIDSDLAKFSKFDAKSLKVQEKEAQSLRVAANIWTENIFVLKEVMKNRFNTSDDDVNRYFEIPVDLDYI